MTLGIGIRPAVGQRLLQYLAFLALFALSATRVERWEFSDFTGLFSLWRAATRFF